MADKPQKKEAPVIVFTGLKVKMKGVGIVTPPKSDNSKEGDK